MRSIGGTTIDLPTVILIEKAQSYGITTKVLDPLHHLVSLSQNGKEVLVKDASITPDISVISQFLVDHKMLTKERLNAHGLSTSVGEMFASKEEALRAYPKLQSKSLVIKPLLTNLGQGISFINPNSPKEYEEGLATAFKHDPRLIVEEMHQGYEYRFLVIGNTVPAVCYREPASVTGDGTHNISDLVKIKNEQRFNGGLRDSFLSLNDEEGKMIQSAGYTMDTILEKGEKVFLRRNSNVSTGGEAIPCVNAHPYYKKIAVEAAKLLNMSVCGIDMLIPKIDSEGQYCILELNINPGLGLHLCPTIGEPIDVIKPLLEHLGFTISS